MWKTVLISVHTYIACKKWKYVKVLNKIIFKGVRTDLENFVGRIPLDFSFIAHEKRVYQLSLHRSSWSLHQRTSETWRKNWLVVTSINLIERKLWLPTSGQSASYYHFQQSRTMLETFFSRSLSPRRVDISIRLTRRQLTNGQTRITQLHDISAAISFESLYNYSCHSHPYERRKVHCANSREKGVRSSEERIGRQMNRECEKEKKRRKRVSRIYEGEMGLLFHGYFSSSLFSFCRSFFFLCFFLFFSFFGKARPCSTLRRIIRRDL